MNTTKYQIELPTLPDGWELCGPCYATEDHLLFSWTAQQWIKAKQHDFGYLRHIIARRKRTLADWANEQPLFKALAEMRRNIDFPTRLYHDKGETWTGIGCTLIIAMRPPGLSGKLTLENGKWKDVT